MSDLGTRGHLYAHRVGDAHRPPAVGLSQRAQSPSEQGGGHMDGPCSPGHPASGTQPPLRSALTGTAIYFSCPGMNFPMASPPLPLMGTPH